MSGVRVLVGTRKGAFVLTSDGKRERWDVSGPHFAGWEIYHLKGSPADPNRLYASQSSGWFGQLIQRSNDGGKTLGAGGQQVRVRRRPRHAPVVRRHAAPLGVQARLASRAVADRSGHGLRRGRRRRLVPLDRRRADVAGASRTARPRARRPPGSRVPAGCACTRSCWIRAIPSGSSSPSRRRACSAPTTPARRGGRSTAACKSEQHPRPDCRGRPLRAPHRDAPVASGRAVHAEALGRHAQRRRRRVVARGQRQLADRLRVPDRRARARAGDHLRRADQERLGALSARRKAARVPQPDGRERVGGAHATVCRNATATSTCCATRWPSTRSIRAACTSAPPAGRCTRRPTPGTAGRPSSAICRPWCPSKSRRCHDPRRAPGPSADAGARRRRGEARRRGCRSRSARSSTRSRPAIRCCAGRSATTSRSSAARS